MADYKPSRHPEMDWEFFARQRPWPMGDRLAIKRWRQRVDSPHATPEFAMLFTTPLHPLAGNNPSLANDLVARGLLEMRRTSPASQRLVTPDELLAECWEVD